MQEQSLRTRLQHALPRGGGLYERGPLRLQQRIDISGDADMPVLEHGATIISYRHLSDLTRRRVGDADAKRAQRIAHVCQSNLPQLDPTFKRKDLLFDTLY